MPSLDRWGGGEGSASGGRDAWGIGRVGSGGGGLQDRGSARAIAMDATPHSGLRTFARSGSGNEQQGTTTGAAEGEGRRLGGWAGVLEAGE